MIKAAREFNYDARPKIVQDKCNLCEGSDFVTLSGIDRFGLAARTVYCKDCGLAFTNPRLTQDGFTDFYSGYYRTMVDQLTGNPDEPGRVDQSKLHYASLFGSVFANDLEVYRGTKAIDIGGGSGEVARMLGENFGIDCSVLDPDASDIERAKTEYGIDGEAGFAEDWNPTEKYDLLFCLQSIDHLADPMGVLRKMRSVSNGLLFVDIVDFPAMFMRAGAGACKIDHPFNFNHDTFSAMLARAGFRVLKYDHMSRKPAIMYVCIPDEPKPKAMPGPASVYHLINGVYKCQASWVSSEWNEHPNCSVNPSRSRKSKQTVE